MIYQIFPSRFATDKQVPEEVWYQSPIDLDANLQGSLRGVIDHLDYLQELGVDILYMTPVFRSRSSHKYDTDDYYAIDPSFGTKDDLRELVRKAHSRGMYVILDGVFNHTSVNFFAFRDLKEKEEQSKYLNWYYPKSFPLTAKRGEKPSYGTRRPRISSSMWLSTGSRSAISTAGVWMWRTRSITASGSGSAGRSRR